MWYLTTAASCPAPPSTVSPATAGVLPRPGVTARCAGPWLVRSAFIIAIFAALLVAPGTVQSCNRTAAASFTFVPPAMTKSNANTCGNGLLVCSCLRSFDLKGDTAMDKLPEFLQDLLYAEEHGLLKDDPGRAAKRAVDAGVTDAFVRSLISERVVRDKIAQAFAGPFRLPKLSGGDLVLGQDLKGGAIRTFIQYANGHTLTVAGTGSGKTTRIRFLVLQLAPCVRGMWMFDLRKQEFVTLRPHLQRLGVDLRVVRVRSIRHNPLQVPHLVHPADFAPRVADMLVQILRLPPRATKLLHTTILRFYQSFNVFAGSHRYPTLFDLREAVAADRSANPPASQAIVDSLDPVLMSLGPEVLGYHVGWNTHDLAQRHIVFELGGAAETDKDLLLNGLILSEFTSRVSRGISNPLMDLYIVCDEALRLVSASSGSLGVADLIGLVRGTGIGLDLSVQSSDVAPAILSNTANKVIGRCGSARDYEIVGGAMGLTADQRQWMSTHLQPGSFVGQLGEGNWRFPFVFRVPRVNLAGLQGIPATSIHLGDLEQLPVVPANVSCVSAYGSPSLPVVSPPPPPANENLSEADLRYLIAVVRNPGQPSSTYPHLAGVGARRAQDIRKRLTDEGYLREHCVSTGSRGRTSIVLEPLARAYEVLGLAGNGPAGSKP